MDLLAAMGTLPVTMDADAMTQLGVTPRSHFVAASFHHHRQGVEAAAAQKGLTVAVENGQVFVTSPAEYRETLRTVRYTVSDLTGDDKAAAAELAALVRKLVAPESWQPSGGRGTIEPDGGALVVVQSGECINRCWSFARNFALPGTSRSAAATIPIASRWPRNRTRRQVLERPVTANFHQPAPLARILAFLAEAAGSDILIDRAALAAVETSDRVEATVTAKKRALATVLSDLLRPLG